MSSLIDLLRGHPSTHLLATDAIRESALNVLGPKSRLPDDSYGEIRHPLHYGPDMGNEDLRAEIGNWTAERYQLSRAIGPERIKMTEGASYGLATALQLCTSPATGYTKQAFIVSPTYFLAASIFEDAGFAGKLTSIKLCGDTIDFACLVSKLEHISATTPGVSLSDGLAPITRSDGPPKRIYKFVMYCVPTYGNPTGETWSFDTRWRVLEVARRWDMLVISDDVYDFLGNDGDQSALMNGIPLPRLVSLDWDMLVKDGKEGGEREAGYTLSNCSFSKLLGPGLRCGWMESATGLLVKQMSDGGCSHSGGSPSHFASTLIHPLITSRYINTIISNLTRTYTIRSAAIISAIKTYLPTGTQICGGHGGFFIWIGLPEGYDAREITKIAAAHVRVLNGDGGECPGDNLGWGDRWVRISVSWCEADVAVEGIRRFGLAVEKWRSGLV